MTYSLTPYIPFVDGKPDQSRLRVSLTDDDTGRTITEVECSIIGSEGTTPEISTSAVHPDRYGDDGTVTMGVPA